MRMTLTVLLCAFLLLEGCCTVLHPERVERPVSERGDWDWPTHIFGNFLLGGVPGFVVDLATGAAWRDRDPYVRPAPAPAGNESNPPEAAVLSDSELRRKWNRVRRDVMGR